jgi:hypothetical protein
MDHHSSVMMHHHAVLTCHLPSCLAAWPWRLQRLLLQLQHGSQLPVKVVGPVGGLSEHYSDGVPRVIMFTGGVGVSH